MIIFTCPLLMEWLMFLVFFAVQYGAGERGFDLRQSAWLGGLFQIVYLVVSLAIGWVLNRRNARTILMASTVAGTALGAAALQITHFPTLLVVLGFFGAALAVFFNSFQTFMRGESKPGQLAQTVGYYTVSWSLGTSLGFVSSGLLYRLGPTALAMLTALVGAAILVLLARHRSRPAGELSSDDVAEGDSQEQQAGIKKRANHKNHSFRRVTAIWPDKTPCR